MKPQLIDVNLSGSKTIQIKKVDQFFLDTPLHFHHLCELVWIEKCFGKRIVGDSIDNFEAGDLVLMGPNLPHIWQTDDIFNQKKKQLKTRATVIYFPANFLLTLTDDPNIILPTQQLINKSSRGLKIKGLTQQKLVELLIGIEAEKGLNKVIRFLQIIDILNQSNEFDYLASVSYKNHYAEKDTSRINTVYQFLFHNFHRDIALKEVADLCNLTPNAFCRYFKSRTQKSVVQFINELRIGHASKLLRDDHYSISNICFECGYNSLANFNKFFKKIVGVSPSEYRREMGVWRE